RGEGEADEKQESQARPEIEQRRDLPQLIPHLGGSQILGDIADVALVEFLAARPDQDFAQRQNRLRRPEPVRQQRLRLGKASRSRWAVEMGPVLAQYVVDLRRGQGDPPCHAAVLGDDEGTLALKALLARADMG